MSLIQELLEPQESAYQDREAVERARKLARLAALMTKEPRAMAAVSSLIRRSFWYQLALCSWSVDHKADLIVKPAPPLRCYRDLANLIDEKTPEGQWAHPTILVEKSRQMWVTWFFVLRLDWIARNWPRSRIPLIADTEEKAIEFIGRIQEAHEVTPEPMKIAMGIERMGKANYTAKTILYPNKSTIKAHAQMGGNAMRGPTPRAFQFDEAAFQKHFALNWKAAKGTANDPRTQAYVVTTPNPSPVKAMVKDTQDGNAGGRGKVYFSGIGYSAWRNQKNRLDVVSMHYSMYEERRTKEWKDNASAGVPMDDWNQEQELDWDARGGRAIFDMFDREAHCQRGDVSVFKIPGDEKLFGLSVIGWTDRATGLPVVRRVRLMRLIDHGTTNFCGTLWIAIDMDDFDWYVYRARKHSGWHATANARAIAELSGDERYIIDEIDAQQGLADERGKIEDLYRRYRNDAGKYPLRGLRSVKKGAGSRQEGLNQIAGMLLSTLATVKPPGKTDYWANKGYTDKHALSLKEWSCIYFAPGTEALVEEIIRARYDERPDGDPGMDQPETSVDMQDDLIDCLRYGVKAAGDRWIRRRMPDEATRIAIEKDRQRWLAEDMVRERMLEAMYARLAA